MSHNRFQDQRFEIKYLIEERMASKVRTFIRSYLDIDEYGAKQPDLAYPVHSLYLDSGGLNTYWHTINGNKNRYKLRLRYYDARPTTPIYFEVKRRMDNLILKQRGGVRREAVDRLLAGQYPEPGDLISSSAEDLVAVQRFVELMLYHQARPKLHISYRREAWESDAEDPVRVTMDRQVRSGPSHSTRPVLETPKPHDVFDLVILELKFTDRFPNWMRDLVETADSMQCGAAKFAEGIFVKGEDWVTRPKFVLP